MPRFAVLPIMPDGQRRYVVYDQVTQRIVDGVFADRDAALCCADFLAGCGPPSGAALTPNAAALGLLVPPRPRPPQRKQVR